MWSKRVREGPSGSSPASRGKGMKGFPMGLAQGTRFESPPACTIRTSSDARSLSCACQDAQGNKARDKYTVAAGTAGCHCRVTCNVRSHAKQGDVRSRVTCNNRGLKMNPPWRHDCCNATVPMSQAHPKGIAECSQGSQCCSSGTNPFPFSVRHCQDQGLLCDVLVLLCSFQLAEGKRREGRRKATSH